MPLRSRFISFWWRRLVHDQLPPTTVRPPRSASTNETPSIRQFSKRARKRLAPVKSLLKKEDSRNSAAFKRASVKSHSSNWQETARASVRRAPTKRQRTKEQRRNST